MRERERGGEARRVRYYIIRKKYRTYKKNDHSISKAIKHTLCPLPLLLTLQVQRLS
jgi:hypothetical protein